MNAFESVTGPTTTTVSPDREEIWRQWGQVSHQNFNLVIDGRDNDRAFDAPASEVTVLAEVVILVEERPFALPTWTVSLTCCGVMIGIVGAPHSSIDGMGRSGVRWRFPRVVARINIGGTD